MGGTLRRGQLDADVVERFRPLSTASVAEAGRVLGLRLAAPELNPLLAGWRICGPAVTMRLIPLPDPGDWKGSEKALSVPIQIARPGDVVVIDCGGRLDFSPLGSASAAMARARGIEGLVFDGACREVDDVVAEGCPTFARGSCSAGSHGLVQTTSLNTEAVQLGSTAVAPGDLVIGDSDGITVVPVARGAELLAHATQIEDRGERMRVFMRTGPDLDELHAYIRSTDGSDTDLRHLQRPQ